MQVRNSAPSARLAPFIDAFQFVEASEETTRTLFPDPGLVVAIRYRGAAALVEGTAVRPVPDQALTGLRGSVRRMRTAAGSGVVVAKFREGAAAAFFGEPLHELYGTTQRLDDLVPHADVDRVACRIAEASTDAERVALFEEFLLARRGPGPPDPVVAAAIAAIRTRRGALRIGALARELGLGRDALEKRFRRVVGASPKRLASLLRMRHAVEAHVRGATLSAAPFVAGFYDQSHFIREFRAMTGLPPGRFFATEAHG